MPITNSTNITMDQVLEIVNASNLPEFYGNVNQGIYDGWLFFIMLWVIAVIIFVRMQGREDQPLNNAMYVFLFLSIVSLFWRAVMFVYQGSAYALVSDFQLYVFPLLTGITAFMSWATKP